MALFIQYQGDGSWEGVETKLYKTEGSGFKDILRRQILGPETKDTGFELRYFEIKSGGYSSLEIHDHTHTVIIMQGRGRAILGNRVVDVRPQDVCHTGPGEVHQFQANQGETLGFYCMVHKDRDRPRIPTDAELELLRKNPELAAAIRI